MITSKRFLPDFCPDFCRIDSIRRRRNSPREKAQQRSLGFFVWFFVSLSFFLSSGARLVQCLILDERG